MLVFFPDPNFRLYVNLKQKNIDVNVSKCCMYCHTHTYAVLISHDHHSIFSPHSMLGSPVTVLHLNY